MNLRTKYINLRPVVIITAGLILGILAVYTIKFNSVVFGWILLALSILSLLATFIYFTVKKQKLKSIFIGAIILSALLGSVSTVISTGKNYTETGYSNFNGNVTEIYSETITDNSLVYSVIIKGNFLSNKNTKVYAKITTSKRIYVGSRISFSGYFSPFSDNEFSFSSGAHYYTEVDSFVAVYDVEGIFNKIKYNLFTSYDRFVDDTSGINYAIITGDTQYIDINLLQKYREIGVAHLFAVSGLHVGLLYGFLLLLLKKFKNSHVKKVGITLVILLLYVAFCGFSSSSVRAFIIIAVREVAKALGKKPDSTTNLAISAYIILLFNPQQLVSVGFLLSYSVYLGLILLVKPIEKLLSKLFYEKVATIVSASITAEIVSFPILLHFFGYASPFSFIFNLIIIPVIAVVFPMLFICAFLLSIFPSASIFTIIPNLFFIALNHVISLADTSLFLVKGVQVSLCALPFYLLLYSFTGKINFTKKQKTIVQISLYILTVVLFIAQNFV